MSYYMSKIIEGSFDETLKKVVEKTRSFPSYAPQIPVLPHSHKGIVERRQELH